MRVWSCLLVYPSHIFNFGLSCFPFAGAHAQQRVRAVVFVHDPCAVFAFLIVAFAPMDRKGISKSAKPYRRTPRKWFKKTAEELEEHVCKLSKKGFLPSQIGVILRDAHGVPSVKSITGTKVLLLLKRNGV